MERFPDTPERTEVDHGPETRQKLLTLIGDFFPEDAELYADDDPGNFIGAVYGALLEAGEDPDEVLAEYGIAWPDLEDKDSAEAVGGGE